MALSYQKVSNNETVLFKQNCSTYCFRHMVQNSFAGEKLLTSGWGYYDVVDPKKSSVLKAAIVNGISNADCKAAFGADGVRLFKRVSHRL
jgi:hypothetical protein